MHQNGNAIPPIQYPTLLLDGVIYQMKLGLGASYLLEQNGIDASKLEQMFREKSAPISLIIKLAASMLGQIQPDGKWKSLGIEPLALADLVAPEQFAELSQTVVKALVKVPPAGASPAQSAETPSPALQ